MKKDLYLKVILGIVTICLVTIAFFSYLTFDSVNAMKNEGIYTKEKASIITPRQSHYVPVRR